LSGLLPADSRHDDADLRASTAKSGRFAAVGGRRSRRPPAAVGKSARASILTCQQEFARQICSPSIAARAIVTYPAPHS
jgi:hypothetical protein